MWSSHLSIASGSSLLFGKVTITRGLPQGAIVSVYMLELDPERRQANRRSVDASRVLAMSPVPVVNAPQPTREIAKEPLRQQIQPQFQCPGIHSTFLQAEPSISFKLGRRHGIRIGGTVATLLGYSPPAEPAFWQRQTSFSLLPSYCRAVQGVG